MKIIGTFLSGFFGAFVGVIAIGAVSHLFGMVFTDIFMGEVSWEVVRIARNTGIVGGFVLGLVCGLYLLNDSRRQDAELAAKYPR